LLTNHKKPNAPCKDCTERVLGCRTDCEPWKQYERERAEWGKEVKVVLDQQRTIRDYKYRGIYKRERLDLNARRK
jgi:hypothetical protein